MIYTISLIVCKDSKKESYVAPFLGKNVVCSQNFVFFAVFSPKIINFVARFTNHNQ